MTTASHLLTEQHRHCDDHFADAENAARQSDWPACATAFELFRDECLAHFELEENRLFPAFERATGMSTGPTMVMRAEHADMRQLISELAEALTREDRNAFLGSADTLLILIQQHNMKEENILYPMCDARLPDAVALVREAA